MWYSVTIRTPDTAVSNVILKERCYNPCSGLHCVMYGLTLGLCNSWTKCEHVSSYIR